MTPDETSSETGPSAGTPSRATPDATVGHQGSRPATPHDDHQPQDDAARERFRAALDRKGGRDAGKGAATGQQARAHGPSTASAATQRMFRRKSGG